jgi:hypothetical protein
MVSGARSSAASAANAPKLKNAKSADKKKPQSFATFRT